MIEKLADYMRSIFGAEDLTIFMIVMLLVTLLPMILFALHYKPLIRTTAVILLGIYIIGNLSFTILDRETLSTHYIILPGLSSYRRAFYLDLGIFGTLREAAGEGIRQALRHVHLQNRDAMREILLNILLYVPLGYILSFVFPRKHRHILLITLIGFLCSCATEAAQLYWRIGYFHVDDIINNTLGTFAGALIGCILAAVWRVA